MQIDQDAIDSLFVQWRPPREKICCGTCPAQLRARTLLLVPYLYNGSNAQGGILAFLVMMHWMAIHLDFELEYLVLCP